MRQHIRTTHIAAAALLMGGLSLTPAALAAPRSSDGWQSLQPTASDSKRAVQALLANVPVPAAGNAISPSRGVASPETAPEGAGPAGPYRLVKGEPLQLQLERWAARAGWTVVWNVPDGWIVPGDKEYGTDFEAAVQRAIEELASNGADVVGDSWRGNRTVIISQNGVVQ
ncbi:toxin co-regulated pilus biosynthesis Q family protein [Cupriavidus sp. AU9028]|uniref:toxin co-regulated pilus biosynthesis Q family protein n=1 Tax=Cupriavidus sp. AU9028 TaxID=2871157 RepID=UPI001C93F8CA|nr:toxin co-regulated pilus biosynthesis Q family protein [Cupriavidus sp. AU9028]MBY4898650.1 toxin co-regulated pilus biosynthesis Q family protein [Cupriavidus sp. AU9028]